MIEMQVSKQYIGDIITGKTMGGQRAVERIIAMEIIVSEKFSVLLIAHTGVYQYQPVPFFYQQTAHRPGTHIIFIVRVEFVPHAFRNNAKHGASI
jgi:hypothetical protein